MTRAARFTAIALGLFALGAAPALAAPDHTAVLSSASPKFDWEGAPQTTRGLPLYVAEVRQSIPCKTPGVRPCEEVLFEVKEPGKLTVKVDGGSGDPPEGDVDLIMFKSDAQGAAGEKVGEGVAKGPDTVSIKVTPGFYLGQVDYYHGFNTGYKGNAVFVSSAAPASPAAPAVTAPAPASTAPAPASAPAKPSSKAKAKAALKRCQKKAKKIKNAKKRKAALKRCAKKYKQATKKP